MQREESRSNSYALAGWLAIVAAVLIVPEIGLAVLSEFLSSSLSSVFILVHTINLAIGIYILYMFRDLLHESFAFRKTDVWITLLIVMNVLFFFVGLIEFSVGSLGLDLMPETSLSMVSMILFVLFGIITIVFGVVLLILRDDLYGLLKPYAFTTIASGVFGATIILAPFGLIAAIIALVIPGMIFLRAGRESEIL